MSILLSVTKHFLQEGINKIITNSEQADRSVINEARVLLLSKGRDISISASKRDTLVTLLGTIKGTDDAATDEASFKSIEGFLLTALESLGALCAKHGLKPSTTESDLSALKEYFFDEMKKMLKVDLFKVKDKKLDLDAPDAVYEPLDVLLYYVTMYQAHIIFDEHNSVMKHGGEYIDRKMAIIMSHIRDYCKIVEEDIKPKHAELLKAKARSLKPQIELIQFNAKDVYTEYRHRLWGGSVLTPYKDQLDHYMSQALATINERWFIEVLDPPKTSFESGLGF